jgi:hypothetical protein
METPLNNLNYLNVAAFVISWALNSEVDMGPDFEYFRFLDGMRELGRRYESMVTPAETTFLIAHFVLLFQGVFAVTQMLPKYRGSVLVQDGVSHWFFASVVVQLIWSINFALENLVGVILSVVLMGVMVYFNSQILMNQAYLTEETQVPEEYWLLRFPFSLHTGWTMAVFVMSINGLITYIGLGAIIQLIFGLISLVSFVGISGKMLFANGDKANYAIPAILGWVTLGVAFDDIPGGEDENIFVGGFTVLALLTGIFILATTGYHFYKNEIVNRDIKNEAGPEATNYVAPDEAGTLA